MAAVVTKAVAEIVPADNDADTPNGAFEVILSAPTLDRDGDTLKADEWKTPLPDHITFDMDHGMTVATTIGSGAPRIEDDGTLRVSGTYSSLERGQEVRTLVNEGHIRTTSVAFMTTKSTKGAKPVRELLNGAFVAVPSNREAVVLSSKGLEALEDEITKAGARNSARDQTRIQEAHDSLVAAGATCTTTDGKAARATTTKSIVGSVEALQDRVREALELAYGAGRYWWGWLRGVIPSTDGGGAAIFDSSQVGPGERSATYSQTFTDDGTTVTLTGTATEVDIHEIVAASDATVDADDTETEAEPGSDELQLRAAAIRARMATALHA